MAAIGGFNSGILTGYSILDQKTGEVKPISEIFEGGAGTPGPKGDKGDKGAKGDTGAAGPAGTDGVGITNITAAQADGVVTLTFNMSDGSTKTATYTLPA